MTLSLKNNETEQLVRKLAEMTDESMTTAVTVAVKERIERLEKSDNRKGRLEWLINLSNYTAPLLKELPPSTEIGDLLYDKETGLPL
jgi:antitoxin VapB